MRRAVGARGAVVPPPGLLVLLAGCAVAAPLVADPWEDPQRHARGVIEAYLEATDVPAIQIAVAVDGDIVWSEAFGRADLSNGREATTGTTFRIASVSKLLTGTLTAKLADAGTLALDRPIGDYVPDLPDAWQDITARMIVHHTSGIAHYTDVADALDTTRYRTTRDAVARFRDRPLAHPPGEAETYSSYAYTLLALAIEHATGRSFPEVMQQEILRPIGMTRTGPDLPSPQRSGFYDFAEDGTVVPSPEIDLSGRLAGSGYLSTAEDLARFGAAHTAPGPLSERVLSLVAQRRTLPDGRLTKEGFGWGPRSDWDGRAMLWGDGSTPGARCGLLVYPDDGLAIAILTNARGLSLERGEFQTLAKIFLAAREGRPLEAPPGAAAGEWSGSVTVGETTIKVNLQIPEGAVAGGRIAFEGWRGFDIADMFRIGTTTWIVPVDRDGVFPLTFTLEGDAMNVTAPRADWSFELTRAGGDAEATGGGH